MHRKNGDPFGDLSCILPLFSVPFPLDLYFFFFFNDTATTEIYTLSLHDALPISVDAALLLARMLVPEPMRPGWAAADRKSTRLNSSHANISYAVFCLKKKKTSFYLKTVARLRSMVTNSSVIVFSM